MTHNIKCLQFYIADKIKYIFLLLFKWSENSRSGFYFILLDFFVVGTPRLQRDTGRSGNVKTKTTSGEGMLVSC